jgi:hypothetical protein
MDGDAFAALVRSALEDTSRRGVLRADDKFPRRRLLPLRSRLLRRQPRLP